ncbi:MAG: hypothetical protein KAR38_14855 [Calditrichia bacterium]|nr:hypothetical protein [Calditrichia bacterium]
MKRNIFIAFIVTIFIFLLQACYIAPRPVFRAVPDEENTVWLYGKEYLELQTDSYDIAIAFEGPSAYELVFDIEITNRTTKPVLVDPGRFHYDAVNPSDTTALFKYRMYAKNPEIELINIAKNRSRENAGYATRKGNEALFSLFNLVVDIATITEEKTEEEIEDDVEFEMIREENSILKDIEHEEKINALNNEVEIMETTALRKTTLGHNYAVRGQIYFKIGKYSKYIKLHLPIGKENVEIVYKLQKYSI